MADLKYYATDTHSLLWHLYDIPLLTSAARSAFAEVEDGRAILLIPAIVLAEAIFTIERRKHDIDVVEFLDRIAGASNYQVLPFDLQSARWLQRIIGIPEMHDRMIVCAALAYQAPLVTGDIEIRQSGIVETVW